MKKNVFTRINNKLVDEYKTRLIKQSFSPLTINRKLSSLRKYLAWAKDEGIIKGLEQNVNNVIQPKEETSESLLLLATNPNPIKNERSREYSKFPPFRLVQKTTAAGEAVFEIFFITPLAHLINQGNNLLWQLKGKPVFIKPDRDLKNEQGKLNPVSIASIPKEFYAPYSISTKHFSLIQKLAFHARHTRPEWYRRYQSIPLINYFHLSILFIIMSGLGVSFYNGFFRDAQKSKLFAGLSQSSPRVLAFKGRLADSEGTPITSPSDVRFIIYNNMTASSSARKWEEVTKVTPDKNGVFYVYLGGNQGSPSAFCNNGQPVTMPATGSCGIPNDLFESSNSLWLGITIGSKEEMSPRQQIATSTYSSNSDALRGLVPITHTTESKNVVLALDSSGDLTIGSDASPTFAAIGGEFTLSGQVLSLKTEDGSNNNIKIAPDGLGKIDLQKPLVNSNEESNLSGIPGAVEVNDLFAIAANSSSQSALTVIQSDFGPLINAMVGKTTRFSVDYSGNIKASGNGVFSGNVSGSTIYIGNSTAFYLSKTTSNLYSLSLASDLNVSGKVSSDLIPKGKVNLGSSGSYWDSIYVNNIYFGNNAKIGFWNRDSGTVSPANLSDELLIGGNSTSSALVRFASSENASSWIKSNLGIGTATASARLDIGGNASMSGSLAFRGLTSGINVLNGNNFEIKTSSSGDTGLATRITLLSNGNLGIGDFEPSTKLSVLGEAKFSSLNDKSDYLKISNDNDWTNLERTTNSSSSGPALQINNLGIVNVKSGWLGIGTQTPLMPLDIRSGGASISGNLITNGYISSAPNYNLTLQASGNISGNGGNSSIYFKDTNGAIKGRLDTSSANGILHIGSVDTVNADLAENYPTNDPTLMAEEIVSIDASGNSFTLMRSNKPYQQKIIGVISANPGLKLGSEDHNDNQRAVALKGRVPVKVTSMNGPIKAGDPITSSDIAGVGMKATKPGQIIGTALQAFDCPVGSYSENNRPCTGSIMVFVNVGFFDPDPIGSISENIEDFAIEKANDASPYIYKVVKPGHDAVQKTATFASLMVGNVYAGLIEAQKGTFKEIAALAGKFDRLETTKFISPIAEILEVKTNIISPLAKESKIAVSLENSKFEIKKSASESAVASIDNEGNFVAKSASLAGELRASEASIAGTLRVKKIVADEIEGLASSSAQYITNNYYISTPSGDLASSINTKNEAGKNSYADISSFSAQLDNLNVNFGRFEQGLIALGPSSMADLSVNGNLLVGTSMNIGDNTIDVLGADLHIQPLRQGGINFLSGLFTIDTGGNIAIAGNATIKGTLYAGLISPVPEEDLIFKMGQGENSDQQFRVQSAKGSDVFSINQVGDIIASGSATISKINFNLAAPALALSETEAISTGSAGIATISAQQTQLTISNPNVTEKSLIYITPVGSTNGFNPYLLRQKPEDQAQSGTEGSFTVGIDLPLQFTVSFNWLIIN